jgi:hypothetical protein
MTAHTDLPSAFILHLLTSIDFRSFSIQANHLNFGLPAFLLPSCFPSNTVEHGYNDIGLYDTSPIASDILWYQLIVTVNHNITLLGYSDIRLKGHKIFSPFYHVIIEFDCTFFTVPLADILAR